MSTNIQDRVAKGAALLDEKVPGWSSQVERELSGLSLEAQVFGIGRSASGLIEILSDRTERTERYRKTSGEFGFRTRDPIMLFWDYGFVTESPHQQKSLLHAWEEEIEVRRGVSENKVGR